MKANEFVKLVGWGRAKQHIKAMDIQNWHNDFYNNLKRLVESYGLAENHNGVDMAKRFIDVNIECNDLDRLKQAIAGVESCMEGL